MTDYPIFRSACNNERWCEWPHVRKNQLRIIEVRDDGIEVLDQVTVDCEVKQWKRWRRYCPVHFDRAVEILEHDTRLDLLEQQGIIDYLDKVTTL